MNKLPYQSLKQHNTFAVDAQAEAIYEIFSTAEFLSYIKSTKAPFRILGGGSNVLLTQDLQCSVLINKIKGIEVLEETEHDVLVKFMSGEVWHDCVLWALAKNLGGIENLSLIPGTIGAAPIQNIGAYGVELQEVFVSLEAIDTNSAELHEFTKEQCKFGYRDSIFKHVPYKDAYFITSVTLRLQKNPKPNIQYGSIQDELAHLNERHITIQDVSDAVIRIRSSKLPNPAEIGNAGSFFKNPVVEQALASSLLAQHPTLPQYPAPSGVKLPAAWLIEHCGWKGFRNDDFGVHSKQALVLVNYGTANGSDIYALSSDIITSVQRAFNITLEREVNIW